MKYSPLIIDVGHIPARVQDGYGTSQIAYWAPGQIVRCTEGKNSGERYKCSKLGD